MSDSDGCTRLREIDAAIDARYDADMDIRKLMRTAPVGTHPHLSAALGVIFQEMESLMAERQKLWFETEEE